MTTQGLIPFGTKRPGLRHQPINHRRDLFNGGIELGHHFTRIQEESRHHGPTRVDDDQVACRLSVRPGSVLAWSFHTESLAHERILPHLAKPRQQYLFSPAQGPGAERPIKRSPHPEAAYGAVLHDGAHTTCDFPMNLRVVMVERTRCVPHKKHDMVEVLKGAITLNGEPLTFDW